MLAVSPSQRILIATEPVDFRKGIDSLAALIRQAFGQDPMSGTLFIFTNRRRTALKVLVYDGHAYWLCLERLSKGRFKWWPDEKPHGQCKHYCLPPRDLPVLLWNGDPESARFAPMWKQLEDKSTAAIAEGAL